MQHYKLFLSHFYCIRPKIRERGQWSTRLASPLIKGSAPRNSSRASESSLLLLDEPATPRNDPGADAALLALSRRYHRRPRCGVTSDALFCEFVGFWCIHTSTTVNGKISPGKCFEFFLEVWTI